MSVKNDGYDGASAVNVNDIMSAIRKLKSGKRDGSLGLCTDHFINACSELAAHVALLFSAMPLHGIASDDMHSCTLIPIPKGKTSIYPIPVVTEELLLVRFLENCSTWCF